MSPTRLVSTSARAFVPPPMVPEAARRARRALEPRRAPLELRAPPLAPRLDAPELGRARSLQTFALGSGAAWNAVGRPKPEVAVIGAGIAGLTVAETLKGHARVRVFEASDQVGGLTESWRVDGRTYPAGAVAAAIGPWDNILELVPDRSRLYSITGGHWYTPEGERLPPRRGGNWSLVPEVVRYLWPASKDELATPWSEVVEKRNLPNLAKALFPLIQACGYTKGSAPYGYFRNQYIPTSMLWSLARRPMLGWKDGTHTVCDTLAKRVDAELLLGHRVDGVETHADGVAVRVGDRTFRADHVVLTGDARRALEILENPAPELVKSLEPLRYVDYVVSLARVDDMPGAGKAGALNFVPQNQDSGGLMMWLQKYADTNVITGWSFPENGSMADTRRSLVESIERLGARNVELLELKLYPNYFPHFDQAAMLDGAVERVRAQQGKNRTWLAGPITGERLSIMSQTRDHAREVARALKEAGTAVPTWAEPK